MTWKEHLPNCLFHRTFLHDVLKTVSGTNTPNGTVPLGVWSYLGPCVAMMVRYNMHDIAPPEMTPPAELIHT